MKIAVRVKEEFSDGESEYSSDISQNSNSNSMGLGTTIIASNGEIPVSVAVSVL